MEMEIPRDGAELQFGDQDGVADEPDQAAAPGNLQRKKPKLGSQAYLRCNIS